jgi:hypothetical protein
LGKESKRWKWGGRRKDNKGKMIGGRGQRGEMKKKESQEGENGEISKRKEG